MPRHSEPPRFPLQEEKWASMPSPQSGQLFTGASHLWAEGKCLPQLHQAACSPQGQRGVTEGGC